MTTPFISSNIGLDFIDCDNIDRLIIKHDYIGPLPNMNLFPKLKKLCIFCGVTASEFEKLDLSSIEDLSVVFKKKEPLICFNLPNIKKLDIYISNNDSEQLSLFDVFDGVIDIQGCVMLEELYLRHCTDYKIKTNLLPKLKKLICYDYKKYDFDILKSTPNLVHLAATNCRLDNIDFLSLVPNLIYLDLSYNQISSVDKVLQLCKLQTLRIKSNPLEGVEILSDRLIEEDKYHFRGKMLHLFLERDYSPTAKREISGFFGYLKDEEKEDLAKKIFPLIESSETEQDAVTKVKQLLNLNITN